MCGINGLLLKDQQQNLDISRVLSRMNQEIIHRGPDEDGFFVKEKGSVKVGMAMRRLSIIDLSTGKQPMQSNDGKITIVFNGEIYNYPTLKEMLLKEGVTFKTTSDTEVILRLYEKFHTAAFKMLDGMFAFSIYDENINKVFIARDFFGEKPLYYSKTKDQIIWASELKSLISVSKKKPAISKTGLNLYFQLTYIPAPFTIYEDICKLEANKFLEIDSKDLSFSVKVIDQEFSKEVDPNISFEDAKEKTHEYVNESVKTRSIADVPLGTFLSGGVDSSIVSLALAQQTATPIDTFSVGFEKKSFDESDKSRTVAKIINSRHHEFIISVDDLKNNIDNILLNFDEPFADSSSLPTYLVAHKTRQHVKVALTGDGGDEVFGGYNKYYMGELNARYTSLVPEFLHANLKSLTNSILSTSHDKRGKRFKLKKMLSAINYENNFYYNIISLGYQSEELEKILGNGHFQDNSLRHYKEQIGDQNKTLSDFRNIDKIISLEGDMLVKVDRTSMLTSLESRAPFLNKKLWNFTAQLPEDYLMKGWNKKYLLKESFKRYFPEGFLDKSKQGFGVPVGDWLRGHLSSELKSYIEPEFIKFQNIFQLVKISDMVNNHLSGKEDNTFRVWTFFCFQKWYKQTFLQN
ncbi:asparagine synthase (glutamine-hydrolyzing) [Antarcticibacterium sp. 1MA-6-2]|uniref:asparagine synthase (glutamine-hydrolyzing) n=1 Tax=Antarcticibacterium sp. 1MA-6-2 TaxID=2908210 RepID=UPI001F2EC1BC|nr:asparagine synthase (glutamine-hydrolyzing) [Antarcticibacterium sp. 1MA-6-2]UJH91325.1 asparagine synthase (glutamine-hydrolyzing) [Antarcticibacterium sp. 1MA-6-2]